MTKEFTAIIKREGEWYIGYSPEVPGANGQGRTLEECRASLAEAIALILDDRRMEGLERPHFPQPQLAVIGAGFCGGIAAVALYSAIFLDGVTILSRDSRTVMGYALAFGTIGMFTGSMLGLSTKLLLLRRTESLGSWLVAVAVSFISGSCSALALLWLISGIGMGE